MTDQATSQAEAKKPPKKQPEKTERLKPGSLPPHLSLSQALELAQSIHDQGGGTASVDTMSTLTGNTSSSSLYVKKVNALKGYGLVTVQANDAVSLTELGTAVTAPTSPEAGAQAKKDAFLKLDLFNKLYERFKGKVLPEDQFLQNVMVQELKVLKAAAPEWMAAFKDGLAAAGLMHQRGDGKIQIRELGIGPTIEKKIDGQGEKTPPATPPATPAGALQPLENGIPIPLGIGRIAYVQLPTGFKVTELTRLLKTMALALNDGTVNITVSDTPNGAAQPETSFLT